MDLKVPNHPAFAFGALPAQEALEVLRAELRRPEFFVPALSMVEAPSDATFLEAYQEKTIWVWQMRHPGGAHAAYVIFNAWTTLPSIFVFSGRGAPFDVALTQAALEAAIPQVYAADAENLDILTPVPHPGHPDAELMLATLGFETIGARQEFEAQMVSYWLQRHIYEAYFGPPQPRQKAP